MHIRWWWNFTSRVPLVVCFFSQKEGEVNKKMEHFDGSLREKERKKNVQYLHIWKVLFVCIRPQIRINFHISKLLFSFVIMKWCAKWHFLALSMGNICLVVGGIGSWNNVVGGMWIRGSYLWWMGCKDDLKW